MSQLRCADARIPLTSGLWPRSGLRPGVLLAHRMTRGAEAVDIPTVPWGSTAEVLALGCGAIAALLLPMARRWVRPQGISRDVEIPASPLRVGRRRSLAALLLPLGLPLLPDPPTAAAAPSVLLVDAAGGGDFPRIQGALDAAPSGATVVVRPGEYREALRIEQSVTVEAASVGSVTLLPPPGTSAIAVVRGDDDDDGSVTLRGLSVEQRAAAAAAEGGGRGPPAVAIDSIGVDVLLVSCDVENGAGPGMVVTAGTVIARDCCFHDCDGEGLRVTGPSSRLTLKDGRVVANRGDGVVVSGGAACAVRGCRITGNGGAGAALDRCAEWSPDPTASLTGNARGPVAGDCTAPPL